MNALPAEAEALAGMDRSYTVTVLAQVRALVSQLAQGKEHRTLLLCSDGFQLVPGREVWGLLVAYFPELNRYALRTVERLSGEFDAIVKVAAKSNIIIDTIDSRGLYTSSYFDASNTMASASIAPRVLSETDSAQSTAGDSLMELAAATGGTAYFNSNDIYAGIRKAVAEGRDYYTLAYVPANSAMDGKYRKIAVEVKGRKLTVKAKRGYWATEN
jgi:VWFA-related protein